MEKKRVILFKKSDDAYRNLFEKQYKPDFIPVLDHALDNVEALAIILSQGPQDCKGLILTSQRSVEAINQAYNICRMTDKTHEEWNTLPIYIVGPKTADVLAQSPLFQSHDHRHWVIAPRASELIKDLLNSSHYLFLAGDKRRDLIPEALHEAHIPFHEVQTYATCPHPELKNRMKHLDYHEGEWLVFFSPSGIKFIKDASPDSMSTLFGGLFRIAAIGPTTADFITKDLNFQVDVVADKPDAEHLFDAMVQFDTNQ
ncbi:tetrapyrrole biosynthesis, uroporphyrinogen III synthase [Gilbertella persicaria]|uniref:Tetrapyrrole biosynthesis uroporphyrinogen III synthase domain-containing protein n=1 Tax=Rhizopus stolonifer TaxID=4846 RepID=A0A367KYC4_RHIST|nr:tetrapyrrole biosynthesis, uroporphyrinogen III synthase [Gilbertella persicaria]KAI8079041.1 tetrapyrrole biosynthesis, uroporphyrinogen III synthase [Gilbertella persicaria]RCI06882.1 hypothetical protein CU098_013676 [Rhizopus stolonifer]